MLPRKITALALASGLLLVPAANRASATGGSAATARQPGIPECPVIQIHGSVKLPTGVTNVQLKRYPTATINGVTGVPLEYLLFSVPYPTTTGASFAGTTGTETVVGPTATTSMPYGTAQEGAATLVLPNQEKLGFLAAVLTVRGFSGDPLAVAVGELDAGYGAHPALLTGIGRGQPTLVFPTDRDDSRTVPGVFDVAVTVVDPSTPDSPNPPGSPAGGPYQSVVVRKDQGSTVQDLWVSQLQALPQVYNLKVSYLAMGGTSTKYETGPSVGDILHYLDFHPHRDTAVWATGEPFGGMGQPPAGTPTDPLAGNSSYSIAVTPAEAGPGDRPLLISVDETSSSQAGSPAPVPDTSTPRLIPAGDVSGARYNSDFATLTILDTATSPAPRADGCAFAFGDQAPGKQPSTAGNAVGGLQPDAKNSTDPGSDMSNQPDQQGRKP